MITNISITPTTIPPYIIISFLFVVAVASESLFTSIWYITFSFPSSDVTVIVIVFSPFTKFVFPVTSTFAFSTFAVADTSNFVIFGSNTLILYSYTFDENFGLNVYPFIFNDDKPNVVASPFFTFIV